ncbi:ROK family transcriptional regulator [Streptomyces albiaxialis]|uniref:ROK family transcriptional regulator n=1 Tax=Streptomyces albiaxialis TaxID=329523 RepID=A0ABN2VFF0_9ACTN
MGPGPDTSSRPSLSFVSPAETGRINRARLLRLLYAHGPLSRSELARLLGAQRAVVGAVAQPLIEEGLLAEGAPRPSGPGGGRGGRPLWFAEDSAPIGAVHLMPGSVRAAVIGAGGAVRASASRVLAPGTGPGVVLDEVEGALRDARARLPGGRGGAVPPRGVGVAVGGMVDTETGGIVHVELAPQWDGLALGPRLQERLGLPVLIDLHPRAQALGDLWFGEGRGLSSFASVYVREAIGVGFVTHGTLHRGSRGAGGEIGHTVLDAGGALCRCGRRGCWDTLATVRWLRARAEGLGLPDAATLTSAALAERADAGDRRAAGLLREYAENLALGLAVVWQLLAPEAVLLHGDPVGAGRPLREAVEEALTPLVLPHPGIRPSVVLAPWDESDTLRGAACLILADMLRFTV